MSELKPCPFCGSLEVVIEQDVCGNMLWNAQCMGCEAASGVCDSVVMAAASWNTRAESADLTAALAENEALRSRAMSDPLLAATFKHMEAAIKRRDEVIEELFVIFKCAGYWREWLAAKLKEGV